MEKIRESTRTFLRNNYLRLGFACFLCYMGCYTGKTILSAISPYLQTNNVFNADQIGSMGFALFVAYGIGQLVNGTLGDLISPKNLAAFGLFVSGGLLMLLPIFPDYSVSMVIWATIGFFCSMMWGPLTKIVAENSAGEIGRRIMLSLTVASVSGTLAAYLIASIVSAFYPWQTAFYVAGAWMVICSISFYTILTILEKKKIIVCSGISKRKTEIDEPKEKLNFKYMMKHALIPTVVYCMMNGFLRNAVSFWIPVYIKETYNTSASFAAAITIILPIFNILGTFLGNELIKKKIFRKSEHILNATLFFVSALTFAVIVMLKGASLPVTLVCLVLASASMNSACNLIYAVYVFRYKKTGKVSTFSGALDCSAYIASGFGTKWIG
ncbi:MAG: MFS transporter, partial [Clostridia bacterium]|nr:MFS transporter [Clostridia bacterium]